MNDRLRSKPPLFIDTCALSDKTFLKWLKDYRGSKSISPIVYMEYSVYLFGKGISSERIDAMFKKIGITISQFSREQAKNASMLMSDLEDRRCPVCNNINWNDCMIAANAPYAPTILVTKNIDDFEMFADWKGRLMTPAEIME